MIFFRHNSSIPMITRIKIAIVWSLLCSVEVDGFRTDNHRLVDGAVLMKDSARVVGWRG